MRWPAAVLIALLGGTSAAADVEVLAVESATGGIWRPGRFSPVRVRVRVKVRPPGVDMVTDSPKGDCIFQRGSGPFTSEIMMPSG